jgi:uncharacterized protein
MEMSAATEPQPGPAGPEAVPPTTRIATLDIVRGVAVMGILAMNIVAYAMPFQAYMNPVAYGDPGAADFASWLFGFIFIDGKMRGLFSFLFGASVLLVMQRAEAKEEDPAEVHYRRMLWLLVFGMLHFYLIWFGDILVDYALMGMLAFFFREMPARKLIAWGIALILVQLLVISGLAASAMTLEAAALAPGAPAGTVAAWQDLERQFGMLTTQKASETLGLFGGSYPELVENRLLKKGLDPLVGLMMFGWETLGYMLLGMAALKSGFLSGEWSDARYRKTVLIGYIVGVPVYAALAWAYARSGFSATMTLALVMAATVPFRPLMVVATAALVILLTRRGGALTGRVAAAGRAAFTNYLGTSILMTSLFYGYGGGLFGTMGRAELWLVVLAMWALMLLWSKPWLDGYLYGPFEWLWRTLARGSLQPMRRRASLPA